MELLSKLPKILQEGSMRALIQLTYVLSKYTIHKLYSVEYAHLQLL